MNALNYIGEHPFLTIIIVACFMLAIAPSRNSLMKAACGILNFIVSPFLFAALSITRFLPTMDGWINSSLTGLTARNAKGEADDSPDWFGWDVVLPILWTVLFIALIASDMFVIDLRLAALLRIDPYLANADVPVDLFLAAMFTAVAMTFAFAIPELRGGSSRRRPWGTLSKDDRARLLNFSVVCLGMTVLAAAILWVWAESHGGRGSSLGEVGSAAPILFWVVLVVPLLGATGVSGFAAQPVLGVTVFLGQAAVRSAMLFVRFCSTAVVWIADKLCEVMTLLLDIPARPGAGLINFFGQRAPTGWRPPPIEFEPRHQVGTELWRALEDKSASMTPISGDQQVTTGAVEVVKHATDALGQTSVEDADGSADWDYERPVAPVQMGNTDGVPVSDEEKASEHSTEIVDLPARRRRRVLRRRLSS